jgi:hypothetical protein
MGQGRRPGRKTVRVRVYALPARVKAFARQVRLSPQNFAIDKSRLAVTANFDYYERSGSGPIFSSLDFSTTRDIPIPVSPPLNPFHQTAVSV